MIKPEWIDVVGCSNSARFLISDIKVRLVRYFFPKLQTFVPLDVS